MNIPSHLQADFFQALRQVGFKDIKNHLEEIT